MLTQRSYAREIYWQRFGAPSKSRPGASKVRVVGMCDGFSYWIGTGWATNRLGTPE